MTRRLGLAIMLLAAGGCAARPVDPLAGKGPLRQWPTPPDPPRVRYLGSLTGSEDFGRRPEGTAFLRELFYGPEAPSLIVTPMAVAVDGSGRRVAVADSNGTCVHLFDLLNKRYRRLDGSADERVRFELPAAVAWVGDELWVADAKQGAVGIIGADGAGGWIGGEVLERPAGLAYDPVSGRCYVVDAAKHQVAAFTRDGEAAFTFGERGAAVGAFNFPSHVTAGPDGELAVADSLNFRIQRFQADGTPVGWFGRKGDAAGDLALPKGVAYDAAGNLWVADAHFENIQAFTPEGRLLMVLGREGQAAGEFWLPAGLAIDGQDRLFVADSYNRRVQVFQLMP